MGTGVWESIVRRADGRRRAAAMLMYVALRGDLAPRTPPQARLQVRLDNADAIRAFTSMGFTGWGWEAPVAAGGAAMDDEWHTPPDGDVWTLAGDGAEEAHMMMAATTAHALEATTAYLTRSRCAWMVDEVTILHRQQRVTRGAETGGRRSGSGRQWQACEAVARTTAGGASAGDGAASGAAASDDGEAAPRSGKRRGGRQSGQARCDARDKRRRDEAAEAEG